VRSDVPPGVKPKIKVKPAVVLEGQWVLDMPFVKPLSLNDRDIWQVRMGKTRPWRKAAAALARNAKIPRCFRVTIELFFVPPDNRARDPLNLVATLKAIEDGIVDAGVIPDDRGAWHISVMPVITAKGPLRPGGNRFWVIVTAHATEADAEYYAARVGRRHPEEP